VTRNFTEEKVTELHVIYYFSQNQVGITIYERTVLQLQHAILARQSCFVGHIHVQKPIKIGEFVHVKVQDQKNVACF